MPGSNDADHTHDGYWKFPEEGRTKLTAKEIRSKLSRRGYAIPDKMGKDQLVSSLGRSDCGLISYHGFSNEELRAFIRDRKIDLESAIVNDVRGSGRVTVDVLEEADEHLTFERFTDLPPELRNRVYEFHFADHKKQIYAPTQPPLTRTCRLVRKESLPLFYSTSNFVLCYANVGKTLKVPDQLALWAYSTSDENFAAIRNFTIRLRPYRTRRGSRLEGYISGDAARWSLHITIPAEGPNLVVEGTTRSDHRKQRIEVVTQHVKECVRGIVAREGRDRLRKSDIFDLRRVIEDGLRDANRKGLK